MKIKILAVTCALAFSVGAHAYDAQINFNGRILNSTCKINSAVTPTSMSVPLVDAEARDFIGAGSTQKNTDFTIALSECTATTTTVKWDNMANVDSTTGALINTAAGGSNVQIRVLNGATPINMVADTGRSFTGASASLTYTAQYYAKTVPVTPGLVSTYGTISLIYN